MGGADAAAQPGKSGAPSEIVCQAGCEQQPGAVVHVQPKPQAAAGAVAAVAAVDDDDDDDQPKTKTKAQAKATDPMMACLAGCWDGPAAFAGVPNATEGGYALTNAKMPGAKPASGEWLVKINRERGTGAGK